MDQDKEWLQWRSEGIGASDIPAILGLSPWSGPWAVWAAKTGRQVEQKQTHAMEIGHYAELTICAMVEAKYGAAVTDRQRRFEHAQHRWMRCTLDGILNLEHPVIVEAKTTSADPELWTGGPYDGVPDHYAAQVAWQMFVTGYDHAIVAALHANRGFTFAVHELTADMLRSLQDRAVEEATKFWNVHVLGGTPPPLDGSKATTAAVSAVDAETDEPVELDDIANVVGRLVELRRKNRALWSEISELENIIKYRMGSSTVGTLNGIAAVSWKPETRTTVAASALKSASPQLFNKIAKRSTTRVFRLSQTLEATWEK